jgi:hypothetical protein
MELTYEQYAELMDELVAEGYDVLEASEMIFNGQLDEAGVNFGGQAAVDKVRANYAAQQQASAKLNALRQQRFGGGRTGGATTKSQLVGGTKPAASTPAPATRPAAAPAVRPAASPAPVAARPAAAPASTPTRPAATPSAKVDTAPAAKPAGSPMQQWAAANPKLAAAAAERSRTRGTSATTNPQMADLKSRLPAPSSPSPSTASTGFKLAKQGVDLSKTNKQKINAGMEIQGDKLQEELKGDGYGGSARPDSLLDAYQSIYKS